MSAEINNTINWLENNISEINQKMENRVKFTPKESAEQIRRIDGVVQVALTLNQKLQGEPSPFRAKLAHLTEQALQLYYKADQEMIRIADALDVPEKKIGSYRKEGIESEVALKLEAMSEEAADFEKYAAAFQKLFDRFHVHGQSPKEKLESIASQLKLSKNEIRHAIRLGFGEQLIQEQHDVLHQYAELIQRFERLQQEGAFQPTDKYRMHRIDLKHLTYTLRMAAKVERAAGKALAIRYEKKKKRREYKVEVLVQSEGSQMHLATRYGQRMLGEGAFGAVQRGLDLAAGEAHAYKTAKSAEGNSELQNEYEKLTFLHQKQTPAGIQLPPHRLLNFADGSIGVEHRLYDGDLSQLPKDNNAIKVSAALQLLQGMQTLAANNLLHKDIKPANVLIKKLPDGSFLVHLADFGGVRFLHEIDKEKEVGQWSVGRTPWLYGERDKQKAWEALKAGNVDAILQKSCVYALGRCLNSIFTGSIEFNAALLKSYPKELTDLLKQMNDPDVEKRPTPQEALDRFLALMPQIT